MRHNCTCTLTNLTYTCQQLTDIAIEIKENAGHWSFSEYFTLAVFCFILMRLYLMRVESIKNNFCQCPDYYYLCYEIIDRYPQVLTLVFSALLFFISFSKVFNASSTSITIFERSLRGRVHQGRIEQNNRYLTRFILCVVWTVNSYICTYITITIPCYIYDRLNVSCHLPYQLSILLTRNITRRVEHIFSFASVPLSTSGIGT